MSALRLRTYAKVNLYLAVKGRRDDGFHEVETILHNVSLGDDLSFEPTTGDTSLALKTDGSVAAGWPRPDRNLIQRAVEALGSAGASAGLQIEVRKRIPIGAGLGGGSANAAGALVGANELLGLGLDPDRLAQIGARLGADVPFFLRGGTAVGSGRGEQLESIPVAGELWFVLGMAPFHLATGEVYARWDEDEPRGPDRLEQMRQALSTADVDGVAAALRNDLEGPAMTLRPELGARKDALLDAGAVAATVSGSGSSLFGLVRDPKHADQVAGAVAEHFDRVEIVHSVGVGLERLD